MNQENNGIISDEEMAAMEASYKEREKQHQKSLQTVQHRIHGHEFLAKCRLPLHWLARLREMRVGDTFIMGSVRHYYDEAGYEGVAEIYAEKGKRGVYHIRSSWTMLSKPSRPHRFSDLAFKIEKGGVFAFTDKYSPENLYSFKITARYIGYLIKNASHEERMAFIDQGVPPYLSGINFDKNNLTTGVHLARDPENPRELIKKRYKFADDQMPKGMMECLIDCAGAMGIFGELEENPFAKESD